MKASNATHFELVVEGLALHEDRQYKKALPYFQRALELCPTCPVATYNLANTLHMLSRDTAAVKLLLGLVRTPENELKAGCPDSNWSPRSICLDAYYILFLCTIYSTESWSKASPFLRAHLQRRRRGLESIWSKARLIKDAEEIRITFAPRAKSITDWDF